MLPSATARTPPSPSWPAELRLTLGLRAGRTRILDASHHGPLRVQRAFHPEREDAAHVVVLHPPAGLVGGDTLRVEAELGPGATALMTSTGAAKAYRTAGARASTHTTLRVADGATLEHVPQEAVIFDGADARLETRVRLAPGARFLGWEVICLGRPACQERFQRGALSLAFEIDDDDGPRFVERGRILGGSPTLDAAWGLRGFAAFGTMVATEGDLQAVRAALADLDAPAAATVVGELLVVRALGRDGPQARAALERARHVVRDAWGRARVDPAIWRS